MNHHISINEDTIIINKQNDYGINIEEINETSLFYLDYCEAVKTVKTIVDSNSTSCVNNIVAFCGNRGTGKTSAMVNFGNALINHNHSLGFDEQINNSVFCLLKKEDDEIEYAIIDPSIIDGKHGLLDIVIPRLYNKVEEIKNAAANCLNKSDTQYKLLCDEFDQLMYSFQVVYRELAIIESSSNTVSFDLSCHFDRLNDLSAAVDLQKDIKSLFYKATQFLINHPFPKTKMSKVENGYFILLVDDVDLDCENARRVMEEIRKYLLIPHVIIIMATRIEQIEMCLQENNASRFQYMQNFDKALFNTEMIQMTYKYLLKVIPTTHRVNLDYRNKKIKKIKRQGVDACMPLNDYFEHKLFSATHLSLFEESIETIIPKNIRSIINIVNYLEDLGEAANSSKSEAEIINLLKQYIVTNTMRDNDILIQNYTSLISLFDDDISTMLLNAKQLLSKCKTEIPAETFLDFFSFRNYSSVDAKTLFFFVALIFSIKYSSQNVSCTERSVVIPKTFWESIVKNKQLPMSTLVDVKKTMNALADKDSGWLRDNSKENKNNNKLVLVPNKATVEDFESLLELLMFIDMNTTKSDKELLSATTSSFINKTIVLDFAQFLFNISYIDEFLDKTGIYNLNFEVAKKAAQTFKKKYQVLEALFQKIHSSPYMFLKLKNGIEEGRGYKEGFDVIEGKCKRIKIEGIDPLLDDTKIFFTDKSLVSNLFDDVANKYQTIILAGRNMNPTYSITDFQYIPTSTFTTSLLPPPSIEGQNHKPYHMPTFLKNSSAEHYLHVLSSAYVDVSLIASSISETKPELAQQLNFAADNVMSLIQTLNNYSDSTNITAEFPRIKERYASLAKDINNLCKEAL